MRPVYYTSFRSKTMPARFVEVTTPLHLAEAARNSDAFSFIPNVGALPNFANFTASWASASGSTRLELPRHPPLPGNLALALLVLSCTLWILRAALLCGATRRALSQYGAADGK